MVKKRERLEVIYDILSIIRDKNNSIKPTPLIRYSNLSTQRFNEYILELLDKNLVKEVIDKYDKKFYTLTDKGFLYLEKYSKLLLFIKEFEL